jgi:trigger factor
MPEVNLTIVREEPDPCRLRLSIEVPQERVKQEHAEALDLYRKNARIPGFRQGKAPRDLVRKRYDREIQDRALSQLVQAATQEALESEKVNPATRPQVENEEHLRLDPDQPLTYAVAFDVEPTFELPDYRGLDLSVDVPEGVSDDEVDAAIRGLLEHRSRYQAVERPAARDDLLKVSYHGTVEDLDDGEELSENGRMILDVDDSLLRMAEPEILPGAIEALVGAEPGSEHQVIVNFPDDYFESSLAGHSASYTISVHEVQARTVPELDDAIVAGMGMKSVEEVQDSVRRTLESRLENQRAQQEVNAAITALLANLDFALPPTVLRQMTYETAGRILEDRYRSGEQFNPEDPDVQKQLLDQAREAAVWRLRRQYVLTRIAGEEGIKVTQAEVDGFLRMAAMQQRVSRSELMKRIEKDGRLGEIAVHLLEQKVLRFLVDVNRPDAPASDSEPDDAAAGADSAEPEPQPAE